MQIAKRRGLSRLWHAGGHSLAGGRAVWAEAAFRQELALAACLIPLAVWIGRSWVETVLLVAVCVAVLVVEMLNTCVEVVVDRIGPEWHPLSKRAKDIGSAAVLLSLLLCAGVWASALWRWWGGAP